MALAVKFESRRSLWSKQMNAREQIVRVLEEVFEQGAYSNIALNQALEHSQRFR